MAKDKSAWSRRLGLSLVGLSFLFYGGLFLVPLISLAAESKVALSALLILLGEVSFWIGGFILGREVVARYRRWLDPRRWFGP